MAFHSLRSLSSLTEGLGQDARFAVRLLFKYRASTAIVVLMLALGLGLNTALATVANAWLVSPYPFPQPDRLVTLEARHIKGDIGAHYRDFLDWRARNRAFEEMAIFWPVQCVLAGAGEAERVACQLTTFGASHVLGVNPVMGRFFTEEEDSPGGPSVALLSQSAWQHRFGGRADILGATVVLAGRSQTIIGVMPDRAALPQSAPPEFWLPLRANRAAPHGGQQYYLLMARLRSGVTLAEARADMNDLALALEREDPENNKGWRAIVTSAQGSARERNVRFITGLFTIAGCLLLLVSANVAGVLLVRSTLRTKELAVRTALGAGRWRLVRQVLVEGLLLASAGAGLGLLVADWTLFAADAFLPNRGVAVMPRFEWPVLLFTASLTMTTGLLLSLWPAVRISKVDLDAALKGGGIRSDRHWSRTRALSALVVVEVALAVALLVAGGLLGKDLASLLRVDTGVNPAGVVTFLIRAPANRYGSDERRAALVSAVIERVRRVPGVAAVAAVDQLPMGGDKSGGLFEVESRTPDASAPSPRAILNSSSPGYFGVLGIPLLQGRDFGPGDRLGAPPVAIVSERLARRFIPDGDVIGRRLRSYGRSYDIVGVVGSVRHDGPGYEAEAEIYVPLAQSPSQALSIVVRASGDRTPVMRAIRQRIREFDPQLPVERLRTMEQVMHDSLSRPRLSAEVLTGLALFGLVLALVGLSSVIAYSTERRTREIAIRVALGATSAQVLRLVVGHGIRLAAAGLILGIPLALGLSHLLKSALAVTEPTDAVVLAAVPVVVMCAAVAATSIPARRAAHTLPIVALKSE